MFIRIRIMKNIAVKNYDLQIPNNSGMINTYEITETINSLSNINNPNNVVK